jgi:protein phosphatase
MFDRTPVVTRVDASYATSAGPAREDNQDALAIGQHPKAYLFAVADGVGAGQDGDEVSAFAAKYLLTAFYSNAPYDLPWLDILTTAFRHINAEVRAWVARSPNPAGTTLTAAVIQNWNAYIAHVGDSRAYLFRQGVLQQLTQDHMQRQPAELVTVVAMEQHEPPPLRDVLTRAIGKGDSIDPQVFGVPLTPGDKLLLTSDGLTNTISNDEIVTILHGNTAYAAELLVRRAIEIDAKDNITAAVVECLADAYVEDVWEAVSSERVFTSPARGRSLKMRKPGDPITNVNPSPIGCFTIITIILIVLIAYWIIAR